MAPKTNADGTALNDLAGYHIYYGTSSGNYGQMATIANATATSYTFQNLAAGTYYFVLRSYDASGNESAPTGEVSKSIR